MSVTLRLAVPLLILCNVLPLWPKQALAPGTPLRHLAVNCE